MRTEALIPQISEYPIDTSYQRMTSMQAIACLLQQKVQIEKMGLVTVTLQFGQEERASSKVTQSIQYFLESLRPRVRKADAVLLLDQTCYFVLWGANQQGTAIVQERLWDALLWAVHNVNEMELLRPSFIASGQSAYPEPYTTLDHCLRATQTSSLNFVPQHEKSVNNNISAPSPSQPSPENELQLLARQLGIPYLSQLPHNLPRRVLRLIKRQLAQELRCFPLGRERDTLTVAMVHPQDQQALDRLQSETGLRIFPVLTHPKELKSALEQL
jgi:Type II secretion system (T2SS), protein E, N-terminal domain